MTEREWVLLVCGATFVAIYAAERWLAKSTQNRLLGIASLILTVLSLQYIHWLMGDGASEAPLESVIPGIPRWFLVTSSLWLGVRGVARWRAQESDAKQKQEAGHAEAAKFLRQRGHRTEGGE